LALALVRDLREHRVPASAEELAEFETDVLAGFVLARASAGLADSTIRNDTGHLELIRDWFGRPLWEMQRTPMRISARCCATRGRRRGPAVRPR
jgi:integrase/recombinase XerD